MEVAGRGGGVEVVETSSGVEVVGGLRLGVLGVAACVVAAAWGLLGAGRAFAAGDANEAGCPASTESSSGFRASLPDCRAYESVSEPNSDDSLNVVGAYGFSDGEHAFYASVLPTATSEPLDSKLEHFLATRRPWGWEQHAISPPAGEEGPTPQIGVNVNGHNKEISFSADFSQAFVTSPFRVPEEEPRLNETSSATVNELVYGLSTTGVGISLQSLPDTGPLTQEMIETPNCREAASEQFQLAACGASLAGTSSDGSRVFFVTKMELPTAPGTPQVTESLNEIYERTGGHTYLVGVLPDRSVPKCGAEVGNGVTEAFEYSYGAVAPSGANVVFTASDCATTGLYLRDLLSDTTVQLPGSGYMGRAGTAAGKEEVIFTSGEGNLYAYHVTSRQTTVIAEVTGGLLAWSADGSRVYYSTPNGELDVWHDGETKTIPGTQAGGYGSGDGEKFPGGGSIPVSAVENMPAASRGSSGASHLLFIDKAQLTSYENDEHMEAYLYDAETEKVTCVSCNPTGVTPLEQELEPEQGNAQLIGNETQDTAELNFLSSSSPFVSEDGSRAVFETSEALVPQDINGVDDVYEWEREGAAGCGTQSPAHSAVIEGCIYMLSSGVGGESGVFTPSSDVNGTHLVGASENLGDIYMQSDEPLLPGLDNAAHLYDVRIDGGFPITSTTHGCEATGCERPAGKPVVVGQTATEAVVGAGNMKPHAPAHRHTLRRRQRLRRALKRCRHIKSRRQRQRCEQRVRRYLVR